MIINTFIESVNVIIILYMIPLFIMRPVVQTYKVAIMMAILFAASGLIITNVGLFASVNNKSNRFKYDNHGCGGGDEETASKQLDLAIKALDSGDNAAAEGYMKEADKSLSEGQVKMHLGEAMKALQAGDIQGAKMHAQVLKVCYHTIILRRKNQQS